VSEGAAWQKSFDELGRSLINTTFVVVDLETTGGSSTSDSITEIGAVKIRGGEVIGEFQTLVNPGFPIPPYITVLTGITDAMVVKAPPTGEALFSFLEFAGSPDETVLVAHNSPFDIGFLKSAAKKYSTTWPNFSVLDTVRIARHVLGRDEVQNYKLSTLSQFFTTSIEPSHRALADARATVDVFHGLLERLGSMDVQTLEELRSFTNKITDAQRSKKHFADGLPNSPGVYVFRDGKGDPLYIGTTRNLRSRVRSYFTAAEGRKRVLEMLTLATKVDAIQTPTIIEAEIRELRLIAEKQPRFNRRSKFQEKAIWLRMTDEMFPRLSSVRGHLEITDDEIWCGPFNGREGAQQAIEAIHEVLQLRQCRPRITIRSMKHASPCALFDMGRCGAPCIGRESIDSYSTHLASLRVAIESDIRHLVHPIKQRMKDLALQERFEEAAEMRNRLSSLINGISRGLRIRSLSRIEEIITAIAENERVEFAVIRHGKLAGTAIAERGFERATLDSLKRSAEVVIPQPGILPASSHEEVERLLRYLAHPKIRLVDISGEWAMPTFCAAAYRDELSLVRERGEQLRYKELFANSVERSAQRSSN
jgi:DNA polymerase-3 subunit epsilon